MRMPEAFIYHLVQESRWTPATEGGKSSSGYLPPTYEQDGFIHATKEASMLLPVANHFYTDVPGKFLCLRIDTDALTSEVKYEAAGPVGEKAAHSPEKDVGGEQSGEAPLFPHIYGPIDPSAVVAELAVARSEDGTFLSIEGL